MTDNQDDSEFIYVPQEDQADHGETKPVRLDLSPNDSPHPERDPLEESRYHHVFISKAPRRRRRLGCCIAALLPLLFMLPVLAYLFLPGRTTILLLGLDARPGEGDLGRTDTIILATINPLQPYVGVLSIPRDLWVVVPDVGENRINTAHFFAEAAQSGSGPAGAMRAIRHNFGVDVDYYVRIRFDGFQEVVDAMGGVQMELAEPMSGYQAGSHLLSGEQALALVRDRQGSDDFFRMERGQIFLRAIIRQSLQPASWPHLPQVIRAAAASTDTNLSIWLWPRLVLALLRAGPDGIDSRTINREMVNPFTTAGGAQVLGPNWAAINPVLMEMFGQ
jgi:polyisoprenyl-teichoic acid--peptidoglycan teichoic acid transferase